MRSKRLMTLAAAAVAVMAVSFAAPATGAKVPTKIKDTRLVANPGSGTGTYSGKLKSKKDKCIKGRKVTVIHLSDPPFTIGETETNDKGRWELQGNVPPASSPQNIKIEVAPAKGCKGASRTYSVDDID